MVTTELSLVLLQCLPPCLTSSSHSQRVIHGATEALNGLRKGDTGRLHHTKGITAGGRQSYGETGGRKV